MKRSEKQIEASRRNGAKSRGPVTPQGRLNSAHPNSRQGMFARLVVLDGESRERFNELHLSLIHELRPSTVIETILVQKMAVAQWRQFRAWNFEKHGLDGVSHPVNLLENPVLSDSRHDRQFERALKAFFALREKHNPPNPQLKENNDPQPNL
jgi:hypothetical protein